MMLSAQMLEILELFVQKFEAIHGKFPSSHSQLEDIKIGVYTSGDSIEKTKSFFQIKAFDIRVNITGQIETGHAGIDNIQPLLVGKFLNAVQECLRENVSIAKKYTKEDFYGEYDVREKVVAKEIVREVDNPTHKVKAAILDKLLFEREATFREQQ